MLYEVGSALGYRGGSASGLEAMAAAPIRPCGCWCWPREVQGFAVLIGGGLARNRHCALVVIRGCGRVFAGWDGVNGLRTLVRAAGELRIQRLGWG